MKARTAVTSLLALFVVGACADSPSEPQAGAGGWLAFTRGEAFACGIAPDRRVWCFGENFNGAVGAGEEEFEYAEPVPVATSVRFSAIDAGEDNVCGLGVDAAIYCWGKGRHGQLGDGSLEQRNAPVRIAGTRTWTAVSVAPLHACALESAGAAFCWGTNDLGQLGDASTLLRAVPVAVAGGRTFSRISAGFFHTCALDTDRRAWCWGANYAGQLGDGTPKDATVPVAVAGGLRFADISAGPVHTCAITVDDGRLFCWGSNHAGELGTVADACSDDHFFGCTRTPTHVTAAVRFESVTAGGLFGTAFGCARDTASAVYCWGATSGPPRPPARLTASGVFTAVAAGADSACGIAADGSAWCWPPGAPDAASPPMRVPDRRR